MPPEARPSPRRGLRRNRDFHVFWAGETVSLFGAEVSLLALPITALVVLGADAADLGLLRFAEYLPFLVLALPLGVLVDRSRRRPLLITANAARALLIGAVPVLAAFGCLTLSRLAILATGLGTFTVLFDLCLVAYLPRFVAPEDLLSANGRVSVSQAAAEIAGPGLFGLLVQRLSAPLCLALNAGSYLVSVLSLLLIKRPEPGPVPGAGTPWRDFRDGLRFLVRSPPLRAVTMAGALCNLAYTVFQTAFLVYVNRVLGFGAGAIGMVLATGAAGGLAGAAGAAWLARRLPVGVMYLAAMVAGGVPALLIPAVSGRQVSLLLISVLLVVINGGLAVCNVLTATLRQTVTPNGLLGRVVAGYRALVFGGIALGGLVTSWLGGLADARALLWVAGLLFVSAVAPILFSPVPRIRRFAQEGASL
ncbi:MFS transporter [Streptomyces mobaraensis]|uniref:MFS transporter n=1 Tax=Streptomyces mobaraensis TaxID=35621 RepID=A0A5N5WB72_STRMB|nr:MFS transporter [Streptomyces mobaraensis]KAB7846942.1 MFS transporter [Streptomyces mobaraensis]